MGYVHGWLTSTCKREVCRQGLPVTREFCNLWRLLAAVVAENRLLDSAGLCGMIISIQGNLVSSLKLSERLIRPAYLLVLLTIAGCAGASVAPQTQNGPAS